MGKRSRVIQQRRADGDGPVAALIATYATADLIRVLDAASVSPTAAQRSPSMSLIFEAAVRRRRQGVRSIDGAGLVELVAEIAQMFPGVESMEDFQQYDGRLEVLVPWGTGLFRLLPGAMERPTQVVRQHRLIASVIDPALKPAIGFGLGDAGELLLRRLDQVAVGLAPAWPDGPLAEIGDDARISEPEIEAVRTLLPFAALIEACDDPRAAQLACGRFSKRARDLRGEAQSMTAVSTFGSTMAVLHNESLVPLPAGLMLEVLPQIGLDLVKVALATQPLLEGQWSIAVAKRVARLFKGTHHRLVGPAWVGQREPLHSLVFFDRNRVLAVGNCASLDPTVRAKRIHSTFGHLKLIRPGAVVETPRGNLRIPDDAEVLHVQLTAGPMFAVPFERPCPTLGLDDLEWILYSERADRDDLWYFIRDLTDAPGVRRFQAWDLIDQWEVWRSKKSFYDGAATLDLMTFSAHAAVAEWEDAAKAASAEVALQRLGLESLRDWPAADLERPLGFEVADFQQGKVLQILPWVVPVSIARTSAGTPTDKSDTIWRLTVGLDWKLSHTRDEFTHAATNSGLGRLRIEFRFVARDDGPSLTVEDCNDSGDLTIGWDGRLQMLLAADSFAVEERLGIVLSAVLAPAARSDFLAAWNDAPPGIRVDGIRTRQKTRDLPKPLTAHAALTSDVLRDLAAELQQTGWIPGLLSGADATALESGTVFPWLIAKLHEASAALDPARLLMFAMVQYERSCYQRFIAGKRLGWSRGFPVRGAEHTDDSRNESVRISRVLGLIVEEVLARPPAGDRDVDDASWAKILAIAELFIESCFRSDAIHWRLQEVELEVSDLFEVNVHTTDRPTDLDMAAYSAARSEATMPAGVPIAAGQHLDPDEGTETSEPHPVVQQLPALAPIDTAMRDSLGFGLDALAACLNVASEWESTNEESIVRIDALAFVEECVRVTIDVSTHELHAAVNWLTLKSSDLQVQTIPHWETERRARRLAVCPFVEAESGTFWALPWAAGATLRILS
ncbi:MAG: hypothetical protein JWN39_71, partial [Ilumatobacteraceae bacterium]|nr:hypothetical protein [Ilumatobacteraceae bacterium]